MKCMPQKLVSEFLDGVPCAGKHGADEFSYASEGHSGGDV